MTVPCLPPIMSSVLATKHRLPEDSSSTSTKRFKAAQPMRTFVEYQPRQGQPINDERQQPAKATGGGEGGRAPSKRQISCGECRRYVITPNTFIPLAHRKPLQRLKLKCDRVSFPLLPCPDIPLVSPSLQGIPVSSMRQAWLSGYLS